MMLSKPATSPGHIRIILHPLGVRDPAGPRPERSTAAQGVRSCRKLSQLSVPDLTFETQKELRLWSKTLHTGRNCGIPGPGGKGAPFPNMKGVGAVSTRSFCLKASPMWPVIPCLSWLHR